MKLQNQLTLLKKVVSFFLVAILLAGCMEKLTNGINKNTNVSSAEIRKTTLSFLEYNNND